MLHLSIFSPIFQNNMFKKFVQVLYLGTGATNPNYYLRTYSTRAVASRSDSVPFLVATYLTYFKQNYHSSLSSKLEFPATAVWLGHFQVVTSRTSGTVEETIFINIDYNVIEMYLSVVDITYIPVFTNNNNLVRGRRNKKKMLSYSPQLQAGPDLLDCCTIPVIIVKKKQNKVTLWQFQTSLLEHLQRSTGVTTTVYCITFHTHQHMIRISISRSIIGSRSQKFLSDGGKKTIFLLLFFLSLSLFTSLQNSDKH